jgi:L-alanine-DL-glutamate epimerase-like enolase superfamily enzyme
MQDYLPYFQARCADVFMVDVAWMGFSPSKKVGDLAQVFEFNVAPHNYYSHLSTFISASLCAVLPNVRILEIDVDDVPLKEELVTRLPEIEDGYLKIPTGPGWGTELQEEVARKNPWHKPKARW